MSASAGSRGLKSFRPSTRGRGTFAPRGPRAGPEDANARKPRLTSNISNGATSKPRRPSSRDGVIRGPSRRGTDRDTPLYRPPSRQIRNTPRPAPSHSSSDASRDATTQEQTAYRTYMDKTFKTLEGHRKQERKGAITDGLLADPDKPTTLADAITIIGTCQDMCAEHERVQRITQLMVDDCEKVPHAIKEDLKVPLEDRMVKRYRRPAAGYEEQLPSDIRPPLILQKTLDYLMDEIVGGSEPLGNVHKFVWDRTRAIRNDFSIQQVTKIDELRIAISCFERIARFHILSLHQLARNAADFDAYQEREQLNNTLLSLIYYYDDSRHILVSLNEPEFRAYCIIFEIQDQRPDLEDRAQNWPPAILKDRRVQTAMKLYAAAANTSDTHGPLRPQSPNAIAQANTPRFFDLIRSPAVPYLMACVAEIYFNKVRRTALDTILKVYKVKRGGSAKMEDWTLTDLARILGFDSEYEVQTYCEDHGFAVTHKKSSDAYVDLGSFAGRHLSDTKTDRKQAFSTSLVEQKRHGRTFPAIVNGMTVAQAQAQGLVVEEYSDMEGSTTADEESLFLPDSTATTAPSEDPNTNGEHVDGSITREKLDGGSSKTSPLFQQSATPFKSSDTSKADIPTSSTFFGKPSISAPSQSATQSFAFQYKPAAPAASSPFSTQDKPDSVTSPFGNKSKPDSKPPSFGFAQPTTISDQTIPTQNGSPSKSIFGSKTSSTFEPPNFDLGTSPSLNQIGSNNASKPENKSTGVDFSAGSSMFKAAGPAVSEQEASSSPFSFLNPTPARPITPSSTFFSQAPAPVINKEADPNTSQPSSSSFFPQSSTSNLQIENTNEQPHKSPGEPGFSFAKPIFQSAAPSTFSPDSQTVDSSSRIPPPSSNPARQTSNTPPFAPFEPRFSPAPNSAPEPAPLKAPDPRPAVLDALAEGLLMEDQGLLQQFIEYTIGPIVREAFLEVDGERSWERAREVRTIVLRGKYLRRWKDIAWKRKLMRKGKERRAIFAKSMQEMARSSRLGYSQGKTSSQSSLVDNVPNHDKYSLERSMLPPPQLQNNMKRKSLPIDFDELPNAEGLHGNKRKRQDPVQQTKSSKHSLHSSFKPHHKRSRTMGESRRPTSLYDNLADFSQLDEDAYANEKVIRQARRLVGHAKLDTTQGDYFALKARGIDIDQSVTPQSSLKRSRADDQIERVRKLLKPSPPDLTKPISQSTQRSHPSNGLSAHGAHSNSQLTTTHSSDAQKSPDDLLAQVRQVREALAEGTAWFQAEREKSERLGSSRSSELPHDRTLNRITSQPVKPEPWDYQSREPILPPTRAQLRLERTKANGLLPPDWDWNKSVTEWKLRGGTGSPRPGASREQRGRSTPTVVAPQQNQIKKPIGLAAATNGLGKRPAPIRKAEEVVYDDDEEEVDFDGEEGLTEAYDEEEDEEEEEGAEEEDEGGYADGYEEGYEEEEYEEYEEEAENPAGSAVLKAQGNSADTAIDLD
ncbi:MAG: hypothetical protein Q9170_002761 [Blastenia crenularia]